MVFKVMTPIVCVYVVARQEGLDARELHVYSRIHQTSTLILAMRPVTIRCFVVWKLGPCMTILDRNELRAKSYRLSVLLQRFEDQRVIDPWLSNDSPAQEAMDSCW